MAEPLDDIQLREIATNRYGDDFREMEKFGHNPSVSNTVFADVWGEGGLLTYLTTARTMTVQSSGVDDSAGTGAQKIIIEGLDSNWDELIEEITLNATVDPTTTGEFIRIQRCYISDVGSGGVNANEITVTATTDVFVQSNIQPLAGQSEQTHFSVPRQYIVHLGNIISNCGKGEDFEIRLFTREFGKSWRIRHRLFLFQTTSTDHTNGYLVPAKADIKVMAKSITSTGKPVVASYDFLLLKR